MNDRAFVDTNVLIYAVGPASVKRQRAETFLMRPLRQVISSQVAAEFVSVCRQKQILPPDEIPQAINDFMDVMEFVAITPGVIRRGLSVQASYGFSWWDSLIISAALEANCDMLYTEDLHAGQLIEGSLRIVNPFAVV